jgi:thiol-disulfide isomerase/thioredoxin
MEFDFSKVNWRNQVDIDQKVLVVEFWSIYCPSCEYTIEHMNNFTDRMKSLNLPVEIIGLSGDDQNEVENFLVNHPVKYNIGIVKKEDFSKQIELGYPRIYLLDKNKKLCWEGIAFDFFLNDGHYGELEVKLALAS